MPSGKLETTDKCGVAFFSFENKIFNSAFSSILYFIGFRQNVKKIKYFNCKKVIVK
jgi:hypothetical protein